MNTAIKIAQGEAVGACLNDSKTQQTYGETVRGSKGRTLRVKNKKNIIKINNHKKHRGGVPPFEKWGEINRERGGVIYILYKYLSPIRTILLKGRKLLLLTSPSPLGRIA